MPWHKLTPDDKAKYGTCYDPWEQLESNEKERLIEETKTQVRNRVPRPLPTRGVKRKISPWNVYVSILNQHKDSILSMANDETLNEEIKARFRANRYENVDLCRDYENLSQRIFGKKSEDGLTYHVGDLQQKWLRIKNADRDSTKTFLKQCQSGSYTFEEAKNQMIQEMQHFKIIEVVPGSPFNVSDGSDSDVERDHAIEPSNEGPNRAIEPSNEHLQSLLYLIKQGLAFNTETDPVSEDTDPAANPVTDSVANPITDTAANPEADAAANPEADADAASVDNFESAADTTGNNIDRGSVQASLSNLLELIQQGYAFNASPSEVFDSQNDNDEEEENSDEENSHRESSDEENSDEENSDDDVKEMHERPASEQNIDEAHYSEQASVGHDFSKETLSNILDLVQQGYVFENQRDESHNAEAPIEDGESEQDIVADTIEGNATTEETLSALLKLIQQGHQFSSR